MIMAQRALRTHTCSPSALPFASPRAQIMFNLERAHFILDEMMMNGKIVETNKKHILRPLRLMDAHKDEA